MSINISGFAKKTAIAIIVKLFLLNHAVASIGYEENTNAMIDTVESASYLNIGDDVLYYDFEEKAYKNGFIDFKDNTVSGIRLEIKELESEKTRIFLIDYGD